MCVCVCVCEGGGGEGVIKHLHNYFNLSSDGLITKLF